VGECEHDHQGQGLSGGMGGGLSAPRASAEAAPSCAGAHRARRADAGRLSPIPAGRWLLAVTQVSGTAHSRSVRVTRPTVPTILSP
jgi:hypothetical protein